MKQIKSTRIAIKNEWKMYRHTLDLMSTGEKTNRQSREDGKQTLLLRWLKMINNAAENM